MELTSHDTSICLIPPSDLWGPVNRLRLQYDRSIDKWPPHINILYPFVSPTNLAEAVTTISTSLEHSPAPLPALQLGSSSTFEQNDGFVLYLHSEELTISSALNRLRERLALAITNNYGSKFTPHLTIGYVDKEPLFLRNIILDKLCRLPVLSWNPMSLAVMQRDPSSRCMHVWGLIDLMSGIVTRNVPTELSQSHWRLSSHVSFHVPLIFDNQKDIWIPTSQLSWHDPLIKDKLIIASYNVLAPFNTDHEPNRYLDLLDQIMSTQAESDIVLLQEVTDPFLDYLCSDPRIRQKFTYISHGPSSQFEVEPLPNHLNIVALSRLPFMWEILELSRRFKPALVLHIPWKPESSVLSSEIHIVGCHLTQGLSDLTVDTKCKEIDIILDYLEKNHAKDPYLLAGDFNLTTSSKALDDARKTNDLTATGSRYLSNIDLVLNAAGLVDCWLSARLVVGESSYGGSVASEILDLYEGEQGATFDPLRNSLALKSGGSGCRGRPQRYDRIYVKDDNFFHVEAFNVFGYPVHPNRTPPSDHWGVRTLLSANFSSRADNILKLSTPSVAFVQAPSSLSHTSKLHAVLSDLSCFPSSEAQTRCGAAIETIRSMIMECSSVISSAPAGTSTDHAPFVVLPVGSYGLGVWTEESDIDCICIGAFSPKVFFSVFTQQVHKNPTSSLTIVRKVKANTGTMLELNFKGIPIDLHYCMARGVAESWETLIRRPSGDPAWNLPVSILTKLKPARDIKYMLRSIPDLAVFRSAYHFIKTWAKRRGVYAARYGYLGGIHIAIMLVIVIKQLYHQGHSLSAPDLVTTFFSHYSQVDWSRDLIFDQYFHTSLRYMRTFRETLCILGWHPPALNTAMTATHPTVHTLAIEFQRVQSVIGRHPESWKCLLEPDGVDEFLEAYHNYVRIDSHYWGQTTGTGDAFACWVESRIPLLLVEFSRRLPDVKARVWPRRFVSSTNIDNDSTHAEIQVFFLMGVENHLDDPNHQHLTENLTAALWTFEQQVRSNDKYFDEKVCWVSAFMVSTNDIKSSVLDQRIYTGTNTWQGESDDEEEDESFDPSESLRPKPTPQSRNVKVPKKSGGGKFRPASDVLNRLKWDNSLNSEDFLVGYEDRFLGAMERPVHYWKTEQTDVEFIPQHRILYFKQRGSGQIMWDRRSRIDLIFGSGV